MKSMFNAIALCSAISPLKPIELMHVEFGTSCSAVGFTPDGRGVEAAGGGHIMVFDIASKKVVIDKRGAGRNGQSAFTPDGKRLISLNNPASDYRINQLCSYDIARGVSTLLREYPTGAGSVDPQGSHALLKGPKPQLTYVAPVDHPYDLTVWRGSAITFNNRGNLVADYRSGRVEVKTYPGGEVLHKLKWSDKAPALAIDSDDNTVAIVEADKITTWNYKDGSVKATKLSMPSTGFPILLGKGRYLWTGNPYGRADLYDLRAGKLIFERGSREMGSIYPVVVAVSLDGSKIAAGYWTGEVAVWKV